MGKAEVWKFFKLIEDGERKKTECQLCKVKLSYVGGNTSTMRNHLKHVHKKPNLDDAPTQRQTTLTGFTSNMNTNQSAQKSKPNKKFTKQHHALHQQPAAVLIDNFIDSCT